MQDGVIGEVADELCLEYAPRIQTRRHSDDVLQAVRALFQLHDRLQGALLEGKPTLPDLDLRHIESESPTSGSE